MALGLLEKCQKFCPPEKTNFDQFCREKTGVFGQKCDFSCVECSRTFKESSLPKESSLVEEGVGGKNTACLEASRTLKESSPCEESSQAMESSLKESSMESSQPPLLLPILVPRPIPCDSDGP